MPPPYALNGQLKLWAFTITLLDGSTMTNIYLFKVPHALVSAVGPLAALDSLVKSLIMNEKSEWLPFVKFDLDVPFMAEEYRDDFKLPRKPFDQFTTTSGIEVYRLTNHKV
jgi:hypothetical protein